MEFMENDKMKLGVYHDHKSAYEYDLTWTEYKRPDPDYSFNIIAKTIDNKIVVIVSKDHNNQDIYSFPSGDQQIYQKSINKTELNQKRFKAFTSIDLRTNQLTKKR